MSRRRRLKISALIANLGEPGEVREGLSYVRADVRIMFGAGAGLRYLWARLNHKMLNFVRWMHDEIDACGSVKEFYALASILDCKKKSLPLVMS